MIQMGAIDPKRRNIGGPSLFAGPAARYTTGVVRDIDRDTGAIMTYRKPLLALMAIGVASLILSLGTPASAESKAEAFCKKRYGDGGRSYAKCVTAYEERRRNEAVAKGSKK